MEGFGIFIVIFIIFSIGGVIINAVKNSPEAKKFFEEIKKEIGMETSAKPTPAEVKKPQSFTGLSDEIRAKRNQVKKDTVIAEGEGSEGRDLDSKEMRSQLTELAYTDYVPIKSRNEEWMEEEGHSHPSGKYSTIENLEKYSGSLGVNYAGEGCEEHYNLRYISDSADPADERVKLTTLQKIIVFGEVINKRKSK